MYVSDITYIPIGNRYAYLGLVTDAFSRKIIGWHLHKSLHAEGTLKALEMALKQKGDQPLSHPLIHHSDRGIQYCCHDYIRLLKKNGITISIRREEPGTDSRHIPVNIGALVVHPGSF